MLPFTCLPARPCISAGQWSIESTGIKFDCSQGTLLRVASYSLFALFGAAALNELALTVLGLRGEQQGPICSTGQLPCECWQPPSACMAALWCSIRVPTDGCLPPALPHALQGGLLRRASADS
jgi:hypothetical protein